MTPARRRLPALLGLGLLLLVGLPRDSVRAAEEAEDSPAQQLTVVDYAASKIGARYVWSAAGPNVFDCSGFVQWVFRQIGVNLPHYTDAQAALTYPVSLDDAEPGDLVFYHFRDPRQPRTTYAHVGILVDPQAGLEIDDSYGVAVRSIYAFPHPEIRRLR